MVKYLKDQNFSSSNLEGDTVVESDCEEDSLGTDSDLPPRTEEREESTRAVLTTGSFSAYVRFHTSLSPRDE